VEDISIKLVGCPCREDGGQPENSFYLFFEGELILGEFELYALEGTHKSPLGNNELWFFTVQKSYNRFGKLGILGLLGIRKINNLHIINTPCKTDPDQVHHPFNHLGLSPLSVLGAFWANSRLSCSTFPVSAFFLAPF
jgi:hypothetical protein